MNESTMAKVGIAAISFTIIILMLLTSPLPSLLQTQAGLEYISYFAFGSNLDENTLAQRVNGAFPPRVPATVQNYKIIFSGPASIEPSTGSTAYGALYQLTEKQMKLLDRSEGVPNSYVRISVIAVAGGKEVHAAAYQFAAKREFQAPSAAYLQTIRNAYADLGHPQVAYDALSRAARGEN